MYQKGNRLLFIFVITMLALTFYFVSYSHATEIKGKVVKVDGDTITILLEGRVMPVEGDIATLFFEHEQLGEMQIGEWKITKVTYPTASAVKIDATGDAGKGGKAVIQSENPVPVLDGKTTDSIKKPVSVKNSHDEALIDAADKGDLEAVKQAINNGADPNAARDTGETALFVAAKKNHGRTVELLLSLGADPLLEDSEGINALGYAVQSRNLDMINIFLNQGVPVTASASTGFSPLHVAAQWAADWSTMAYLIGAGADVNARIKKTDRLPAHFHGVTPLIISAGTLEDRQVLLLLLAGADPSIKSDLGNTALDEFKITKKEKLDRNPNPPEFIVKSMDRIEMALSDPVKGKQEAEQFFREELVDTINDNDVTTLVALEAIGLDISQALKNQGHLLAEAIAEGRFSMARLLLKHGADPLARDEEGRTPFLASVYRGDIELAELFHEKGADPNDIPWKSEAGILQLIYEHGLGDRMTTIRYLISIGADVNRWDEDEAKPLHIAAKNSDQAFFQLLIDSGANPRFKNEDGKSAIDLVPDPEKPTFIKLQNKVWPITSMLVKSIEHLEPVLEKAEENKDWALYQKTAKELTDLGDSRGFYAMGNIYHRGLGVDVSQKTALEYLKLGVGIEPPEPDICNALGIYFMHGLGGLKKDPEKAAEWYEQGIKKGSVKAAYNLGLMYLKGTGVKKDPSKAFILIQRAAAKGKPIPAAVNNLGFLYENGIGVAKDEEMAKDLYKEARELGYVEEQAGAGPVQTGTADTTATADIGKQLDQANQKLSQGPDQESLNLIRMHADKGIAKAQYYLGQIYYYGRGNTDKNYETAIQWFHKAAEQNHADSQFYIGYFFGKGYGVSQNDATAAQWYEKAASNGDKISQRLIGLYYKNGWGVEKNIDTAAKWMKKAADQGDPDALFELGLMADTGEGVEKDKKRAFELYQKAADQGVAKAQAMVAIHYRDGTLVAQDYKEAAKWYQLAADQGLANAQNNLGVLYEDGKGVEKNIVKAKECYKKAADQGDEYGKKNLARLK